MDVELFSSETWMVRLAAKRSNSRLTMRAFYSSYVGGVTTDPNLMLLPIDDHMVHRGHGVYDCGSISEGSPLNVKTHVERLFESARSAMIKVDQEWTVSDVICIIEQTVSVSKCTDNAAYRVFISSGPGGFGIHSDECEAPCLYVVVYLTDPPLSGSSITEITVSCEIIPMKDPKYAKIKAVDYLPNVLLAEYALANGGTFGIWVDHGGRVKEGSIVSVAIITRENAFISPLSSGILEGSTVRFIARMLADHNLISAVKFEDFVVKDLYDAKEVLLCGADLHVYPVTCIDGRNIPTGPVIRYIIENFLSSRCM